MRKAEIKPGMLQLSGWPGSQVGRQESAKLLFTGSIPVQASNVYESDSPAEMTCSIRRLA